MTKALRIFYRKSDEKIVWTSSLEGSGVFPYTIEEELASLPLGTKCITLTDENEITAFLASDTNVVVNDKLIIGEPRPEVIIPTPEPLVFDPLVGTGTPKRLDYIEEFLKKCYPKL